MKISWWWQLLKVAPGIRDAIKPIGESKSWVSSQIIWYNLIKAGVTLLAALGLYGVMSEQEVQSISTGLAVVVPVVATMFDAAANIWLRLHTSQAITGTPEAKKVEAATVAKTEEIVQETTEKIMDQYSQ